MNTTQATRVRRAAERGHLDHGWLDARHTFSFGHFRDPSWDGFRDLVVLNEDRVAPGKGFGKHPHRDMEIVTWVLEGALEHEDSMGNRGVIRPGDIQRMTAGRGVIHAEMNASMDERVHLLQIWIQPDTLGLDAGYEQMHIADDAGTEDWFTLAGPEPSQEGGVKIHQDARLFLGRPSADRTLPFEVAAGRGAWLQVARGSVEVAGQRLEAGDGIALDQAGAYTVTSDAPAEVLRFDLR